MQSGYAGWEIEWRTSLKELHRCGGGFDLTPSELMNLWGRFPRVGALRQPWADGFESRWDSMSSAVSMQKNLTKSYIIIDK